ncbi:small acid-soluble spore protein SspI [Thomasclavelia saccharogumia]|uniref:small acid-soluble spore protein SspI n=1 Tax=Thomasclavelia saccharogumia TaxID=341225 RepID=UPI0004793E42|nr:small acid-soluble spore protein SspI [Thomasclavelia saccharogumia]
MDIRNALLTKLHDSSFNELKEIINEGIASKEETILPGLGVLFEKYYNSLNNTQKDEMINSLCNLLK